jgi:hypothetical protein
MLEDVGAHSARSRGASLSLSARPADCASSARRAERSAGRTKRGAIACLSGLLSVLACCTSPKATKDLSQGRDGGPAKRDAGGGGDEPLPLPNDFEPTIPCGDLGKACSVSEPCKGDLLCSAGTCLPDPDADEAVACGDGCPAQAPICVQPTCVGAEQLACICAQPHGRERVGLCAGLREPPRTEGLVENSLCEQAPDACRDGLTCLTGKDPDGNPALGLCKEACEQDDDCGTACCTVEPGIAGPHCSPRERCVTECKALDQPCDGQRNVCCEGLVCSGTPPDASVVDPVLNGCKHPCDENGDCESGCCVLFTGRDNGICAPASRCP